MLSGVECQCERRSHRHRAGIGNLFRKFAPHLEVGGQRDREVAA